MTRTCAIFICYCPSLVTHYLAHIYILELPHEKTVDYHLEHIWLCTSCCLLACQQGKQTKYKATLGSFSAQW